MPSTPRACPFCGKAPEIKKWFGGASRRFAVCCTNDACPALPMAPGKNQKHAVKLWNGPKKSKSSTAGEEIASRHNEEKR